nr:Chain B, SHH-N peptide [Homo sapiens]
CGPGRGF